VVALRRNLMFKKKKKMVHAILKVFVKGELYETFETDMEESKVPWLVYAEKDIMEKIVTFEYEFKKI
jgi:hypothetical protein